MFKKIIHIYRILVMLPGQLKGLRRKTDDLLKIEASSIELHQRLMFELWKNEQNNNITIVNKGFRVHSQFEEDGLLLYIFSKIGFTNRRGVEMCCGWGSECMLANLILYHSFDGLLFDGDAKSVEIAKSFFYHHPNSFQCPPKIIHAWITRKNINTLIEENDVKGEIDVFSLDVDGIDYYLLEALQIVSPRVIICEIHNIIPADLALTIPYDDNFNYADGKFDPEFRSASLLAMVKLMWNKGYRLVACHRYGFNVIFLRNDVGENYFPEINYETCYNNAYTMERLREWERVKEFPWVHV